MTARETASKIKGLLSTRAVSILILLVAIIGRLIQVLFFFNIREDRSFQLLATDSFVNGHGISLAEVLPSDLTTILYTPLVKWPPGYTVLVAPFYLLFGKYYVAAGMVMDMLFAIVLIIFSRKVLRQLGVATYLVNIYTLVAGFFIYEFYFYSSSDAILTAIFVVMLYYTLRFLQGLLSWQKASIILGILLFVLASFKYSFIPALFVLPLFLLLKGRADRQADLIKVGVYSLLIVTVGLLSILWYQKSISGSAAYVTSAPSGFFPENLLAAFPFLSDAFLKPNTVRQLFGWGVDIGGAVFSLLQVVHLLLGILVLAYMVRRMRRQSFRKLSVTASFFYLAFFVSLAILLLLTALSLRIAKDSENWTFIQEGRYYGVASVFVHLSIFVLYQHGRYRLSPMLQALFYGLLALLFIEGCRGVFFDFNRVRNFGNEEYSWLYEDRLQKYADRMITRAKLQYGADKVAVTGSSYFFNHRIHLYSHVPILDNAQKVNDPSSLNTREPVVLLVMIHERHQSLFQPFLAREAGKQVGYFNGHSFYTLYVTPH